MHFSDQLDCPDTPTRTLRRMIPSYQESLSSPQNPLNRPRGKKSVNRDEITTARDYAGKRSSTPSYIRANDQWSIRPIEPRHNAGRFSRFGGLPPETSRMVFSSHYRPQIRVNIKYDDNVQTPSGTRLRLRKPAGDITSNGCSLRGPLVSSTALLPLERKHATYALKRLDPQIPVPYRRITREHPDLSARMRHGNDMRDLINSQWQYDKRPDTAFF